MRPLAPTTRRQSKMDLLHEALSEMLETLYRFKSTFFKVCEREGRKMGRCFR